MGGWGGASLAVWGRGVWGLGLLQELRDSGWEPCAVWQD